MFLNLIVIDILFIAFLYICMWYNIYIFNIDSVWFERLVLFAYMWCIVCIHNFDYDHWNILVCFDLDHMLHDFRFVLLGINFALCIFDIHRHIWLLLLNMIQILYSYVHSKRSMKLCLPTIIKRKIVFGISRLLVFWNCFDFCLE